MVGLTPTREGESVRAYVRDEVAEVLEADLNRFEKNFRARFFFGGGEDMAMGTEAKEQGSTLDVEDRRTGQGS